MVEQRPFKALVAGSSPAQPTSSIPWEWLCLTGFQAHLPYTGHHVALGLKTHGNAPCLARSWQRVSLGVCLLPPGDFGEPSRLRRKEKNTTRRVCYPLSADGRATLQPGRPILTLGRSIREQQVHLATRAVHFTPPRVDVVTRDPEVRRLPIHFFATRKVPCLRTVRPGARP